ncbi:hypothetical protein KEM52_001000 [Ascosphaera acerosa]|nr:hypothetical protein KEM52_001000 [Ascosphaera acerosa]
MDMGSGSGSGSMSMGDMGMDMGSGVPGPAYLQRMYWACVGAAIGAFAVANIASQLLRLQRLRDASDRPAKPKRAAAVGYATLTALAREVSYASLRPIRLGRHAAWHLPSLGPVLLALANAVVLLVLCFYKLDTLDQWSWENIGYRTGFVSICQLPLVVLLAGKNNLVGALVGSSHERLNWLHRWAARTLWLTATLHMGFWFRSWGRYHYIVAQLRHNTFATTGFAAWLVLSFLLLTAARPVRAWGYELFLPLHLCNWAGFIAAVYYHAPDEVKAWVWVPIGLFCFDRASRVVLLAWANLRLRRPSGALASVAGPTRWWANHATFTPLPDNVTRVTVPRPALRWRPGSHVFLACHALAPFQSHPFTIASIPTDGCLEFFIRTRGGATRRFRQYAEKAAGIGIGTTATAAKAVVLEGPYGTIRPLRQFDSVFLIAGGIGATYTVPLMRDIVLAWTSECAQPSPRVGSEAAAPRRGLGRAANTRTVRFVWVVRSRAQLAWFERRLRVALRDAAQCRLLRPETPAAVSLEISIYLTCDDELDSGATTAAAAAATVATAVVESGARQGYFSDAASPVTTVGEKDLQSGVESGPAPTTADAHKAVEAGFRGAQARARVSRPSPCSPPTNDSDVDVDVEKEAIPSVAAPIATTPTALSPALAAPPYAYTVNLDGKQQASGTATATETETETDAVPPRYVQETYPRLSETSPVAVAADALPPLRILTGRPDTRSLLRATLEQARGESAVVACGPPGLLADMQRSVTALSDERAVHKGTGAQGIYFHSEGFWF